MAKGSKLAGRLVGAEYSARKGRGAFYIFTGSRPEALLLRALALVQAKTLVPAIDKALKEKS